jgi:hypothetical protein
MSAGTGVGRGKGDSRKNMLRKHALEIQLAVSENT